MSEAKFYRLLLIAVVCLVIFTVKAVFDELMMIGAASQAADTQKQMQERLRNLESR